MMESPLENDDLTPAGSRSARASSQREPAAPLLLCEFELVNLAVFFSKVAVGYCLLNIET